MIKATSIKKIPGRNIALQNLSFEQKIYSSVSEKHGELVNTIYDMQNWHLFQKGELSLDEKVELFTNWFGPVSLKKKLREKGDTYIWIVDINGNLYTLFLCSYAFFMETPISTPFEDAIKATHEIEEFLFSNAKAKPSEMRKRKNK